MLDSLIFDSTGNLTLENTLLCTACSVILGFMIAISYRYEEPHSKNFTMSLVLLPTLVQFVIMLVNGNLGTSVAVLGTFSLARFRSVPGTSKEICYIFLAMAIGLATGMGFIGFAILLTMTAVILLFLMMISKFAQPKTTQKELRITIPENLDYTEIFCDLFERYTDMVRLNKVKTTNLGSMYELHYEIRLKQADKEKELIDAIRCRNGNLTVICSRIKISHEEL